MCIVIEADGMIVEDGESLMRIIGRDNIVMYDYAKNYPPAADECLCHVDVEASAAKARYQCRRTDDGWPDWVLTK